MKQHFLLRAKTFDPKQILPGTKWSIKLDGMRAFWDGGITNGKTDVPWCEGKRATGLFSKNAKIIYAPDSWIAKNCPAGIPCEGELWAGIGKFQYVMSVCRKHTPDTMEWENITFRIFEPLALGRIYFLRTIDTKYCKLKINNAVVQYMRSLADGIPWNETQEVETIEQFPFTGIDDVPFDALCEEGHEGIMLRTPREWLPIETPALMKFKPFSDSEATIVGYIGGNRGFEGMIGSLILDWNGKQILVGMGLTHEDRVVNDPERCIPDKPVPEDVHGLVLPRGKVVTFKYRTLTEAGMPVDARFYRNYEAE